MRAFVALPVDDAARREIGALVEGVATAGDGVRWVRAENLHLTLAFLGWIDGAGVPALEARLAPIAAATPTERLTLSGAGGFPAARPRVLWLGLAAGAAWYGRLARAVRTALEEGLALRIDRREPAAHLTLGRAERGGRAALDRVVAAFAGRSISWEARGMVLYSSALGRGGPTYTVERAWRFGPPEGPPAGGAA